MQSKWWKVSSSILGGVVHELKELLAENFILPQIKYVPCECNRVAHELASIRSLGNEEMPSAMAGVPEMPSTMAGVPECIMNLVSNDLAGSVD
jgi:hypothetical protein